VRLGYNTNGFASHRLRDALAVIAGLGYRSVAITLDAGALDPYDGAASAEASALGEWLAERDVLPVVETGARYLLDPWRKHQPTLVSKEADGRRRRLDFLERAVEIAVRLRAPVVSLWAGAAQTDEPREALDERLAAGLASLARFAADRGVAIGFEPEPGMHVEDLAGFERIRRLVDHPALRLTLDVGHAHMTEPSAADAVRACAADLVNVHLEGMDRRRHDHLLPGEGDLDLGGVVAALREVGYEGPANLELSRHSHMAVDAARRAIEFFRPLGLP
jgi:L-ribulose-5-phosphate 3-epimerase